MSEKLKGRRLYPPEPTEDLPDPIPVDAKHGDYWWSPVSKRWFVYTPKGSVGDLSLHQVTEHEDGTITVSPSILVDHWDPQKRWHGYLEHGEWREV